MTAIVEEKKLAKLASLEAKEVTKRESEALGEVLEFVSKLQEVEVEAVSETVEIAGLNNIGRKDVVGECLGQDEALAQAGRTYNGYVLVPAIFEEDSDA